MTVPTAGIFTKEDHAKLKKAQRQLHDLLPRIDAAQACGVECEAFRSVVEEINRQLSEVEIRFMRPIPK